MRSFLPLLLVFGCTSYPGGEVEGDPTGARCEPESAPTYREFVKPFMDAYCVRCHASTLPAARRSGAPLDHDFDTEWGVLDVAEHVELTAAGGPDAMNTSMPPSGPEPSDEERMLLGAWLACHANGPSHSHDAGSE